MNFNPFITLPEILENADFVDLAFVAALFGADFSGVSYPEESY